MFTALCFRRVKAKRENIKELRKKHDKTEDDLKALQVSALSLHICDRATMPHNGPFLRSLLDN